MAMTKEAAAVIVSTATASIIKQQKERGLTPGWLQVHHVAMLRNAVMVVIEEEEPGAHDSELKAAIGLVLSEGCAGNCSAYRQTLEKAKLIVGSAKVSEEYV